MMVKTTRSSLLTIKRKKMRRIGREKRIRRQFFKLSIAMILTVTTLVVTSVLVFSAKMGTVIPAPIGYHYNWVNHYIGYGETFVSICQDAMENPLIGFYFNDREVDLRSTIMKHNNLGIMDISNIKAGNVLLIPTLEKDEE